MIYELRVTLLDVGVPVWRDLQVDSDSTFSNLHFALQSAFNWLDIEPHGFTISKSKATIADASQLKDHFQNEGDVIVYTYNFDTNWEHEIVLQNIMEPDPDIVYPICSNAENWAPDEDHTRSELLDGTIRLGQKDSKEIIVSINEELSYLHSEDFDSGEDSEDDWEDDWEDDGGQP